MRPLWQIVWIVFLIWSAIGAVVMPAGMSESWVRDVIQDPGAQQGLIDFLKLSDAIWMVLAAIVVIWCMGSQEGVRKTVIGCAIVAIGSGLVEWVGAETGVPFGPYKYTDNMGARIAGVLPFTIPLAWIVIVIGARYLVAWRFPSLKGRAFAVAVGGVALLTDLNLEIVAWKIRAYWVWYPFATGPIPLMPPWQNYASWFVLAACFARLLPPVPTWPRDAAFFRPIWVLLIINALFLLANIVRWIRLLPG